jgi:hypothetical protein
MTGIRGPEPSHMGGLGGLREDFPKGAREGRAEGKLRLWEGWEGFGTK